MYLDENSNHVQDEYKRSNFEYSKKEAVVNNYLMFIENEEA